MSANLLQLYNRPGVRFSIYILFLLVLIFNSQVLPGQSAWSAKAILPSDEALWRRDPALANIAYIRLTPNAALHDEGLRVLNQYGVKVVKRLLRPELSLTYNKNLKNKSRAPEALSSLKIIEAEEPLLRTYVVEYEGAEPPELFCKRIRAGCSIVEIAEPYYLQELTGEFIPNDSLVPEQEMLKTIRAFEAWDIFKGDSLIVVGISDSGVMQDHEDLVNSLWHNINEIPDNGLDDDGNGYVDDYRGVNFSWADDTTGPGYTRNIDEGHGDGTAGISSATTDNTIGIAGVGFLSKMFPMKTMIQYKRHIIYGYESIMYAGQNGLPVLNCSWGGNSYSCVNESIVKYAVALDVAIVAGAGNYGDTAPFFPSAYENVLSVGVTYPDDTVHTMSGIGHTVDIMAPGQNTKTTASNGAYGGFCCTSAASPIAAGAVALIRGLRPELTAVQAIEFARLSADNIEELNPALKGLIPGRVNLLKAMLDDPFSKPSIRPKNIVFSGTDNLSLRRFGPGDTVFVVVEAENYLGAADNLSVVMSTVGDSTGSARVIDSIVDIGHIDAVSALTIGEFSFYIEKENNETPFLRFDITGDDGFEDFFLTPFTPSSTFTTFSNDLLTITMTDAGRIGYADPPRNVKGAGFTLQPHCNVLFEGGLMASVNEEKVVSVVRSAGSKRDEHFRTVKPYTAPEETLGVVVDSHAPDSARIGLQIGSKLFLPQGPVPYARIDMTVKNISGETLNDLAAGYFFDWDIGFNGDSNRVQIYPQGIHPALRGATAAAAMIDRRDWLPLIGSLVITKDDYAEAQLASFSSELTYKGGFTPEEKIKTLNGGTSIQTGELTDIATVIGMKFPGPIPPDGVREFSICLCAAETPLELRNLLWKCADSTLSSVRGHARRPDLYITPQPADGDAILYINAVERVMEVRIFNILGELVLRRAVQGPATGPCEIPLDLSGLPTGAYLLCATMGTSVKSLSILIAK